jgi:hypothetical protein
VFSVAFFHIFKGYNFKGSPTVALSHVSSRGLKIQSCTLDCNSSKLLNGREGTAAPSHLWIKGGLELSIQMFKRGSEEVTVVADSYRSKT